MEDVALATFFGVLIFAWVERLYGSLTVFFLFTPCYFPAAGDIECRALLFLLLLRSEQGQLQVHHTLVTFLPFLPSSVCLSLRSVCDAMGWRN